MRTMGEGYIPLMFLKHTAVHSSTSDLTIVISTDFPGGKATPSVFQVLQFYDRTDRISLYYLLFISEL